MTAFGSRRPSNSPLSQISWFPLLLGALFVGYWVFARYLERIALRPVLEPWWNGWAPMITLPQFFVFAAEMLHPRVLRHLIAPIVGWQLAYSAAISLVQALYDLPDRAAAKRLLRRLQITKTPLGKPMKINSQIFAERRETSELLRVGGPGNIAIAPGEVAVTEINGRFHRILGPGSHTLGRLEYIHTLLDLRPQERIVTDVRLTTRDGIEVMADITVTFRLDTGGEIPTKTRPYPYDEHAIRIAAYNETVLPDGTVSTWDNAPLNIAKMNLTKIIAGYRLDELLHARSTAEPYHVIRTDLLHKMRPVLINQGIELTNLHISRLELPKDVADQYIKYWQTHWETQIRLQEADGKAMSLAEVEIARAEAEMTMIQAIVEGVQRARQTSKTNNMHEIIALRLVDALERIAKESQKEMLLPRTLLPQLGTLREHLHVGEEPSESTEI